MTAPAGKEEVPAQFTGYAAFSAEAWSTLTPYQFTPKPFGLYDIDIKVNYCGVCGSDLHVLRSGWSQTHYPCVPGHEITGTILRIGPLVTSLHPGALVGVGAHAWSCGSCAACAGENANPPKPTSGGLDPTGEHGHGGSGGLSGGRENYCPHVVETYNQHYPTGHLSYGGYSTHVRIHENFVYPIPTGIPEEIVAPMFCGGVTMFSPLRRAGVGVGSKVGIVGVGGLGHFGIMFAAAMGAGVTAISHSPGKEENAREMGAEKFILAKGEGWSEPHRRSLDLIISTNFSTDMPLKEYLALLKVGGTLVVCGIPEGKLPQLEWADIAGANLAIRGSNVGSKKEILEMLELVKEKGVRSWVQVLPMSKAGEAVERLDRGEARYRFVLKADWE